MDTDVKLSTDNQYHVNIPCQCHHMTCCYGMLCRNIGILWVYYGPMKLIGVVGGLVQVTETLRT